MCIVFSILYMATVGSVDSLISRIDMSRQLHLEILYVKRSFDILNCMYRTTQLRLVFIVNLKRSGRVPITQI